MPTIPRTQALFTDYKMPARLPAIYYTFVRLIALTNSYISPPPSRENHLLLLLLMGRLSPLPLLLLLSSLSDALSTETILVAEKSKNFHRMPLQSAIGPESVVFDTSGGGPYTGVSDGRVLRWDPKLARWAQFAVPPRRRGVTAAMCTGSSNPDMESKCGRPLGLQFHRSSGYLYIADAYYGLLAVGAGGGLATCLAASAEGVPFKMTNAVDVDQDTGVVYFTDSSSVYPRSQYVWVLVMGDASGRFMSYDPRTKRVKVLLRGLEFANGVAVSSDNSFVLVAESSKQRLLRYWIKGAKAGTSEVFANVTAGYPDNVRRSPTGEFWVGVNTGKGKIQAGNGRDDQDVAAMRFDPAGRLTGVLYDYNDGDSLSEVVEVNSTLYFGSVVAPYLGVYKLLPSREV